MSVFSTPDYYNYSLVHNCWCTGSISKGLVVLQKNNNVSKLWDEIFERCYFFEMSFMLGVMFVMCYFWQEECISCNIVSMDAINVRWPQSFWPDTPVGRFGLCYLAISYSVIFRRPTCGTYLGRRLDLYKKNICHIIRNYSSLTYADLLYLCNLQIANLQNVSNISTSSNIKIRPPFDPQKYVLISKENVPKLFKLLYD